MSSKFAWSLEKIRNLEQYTLKIIKILRTASLASNFTGSYIKKSVPTFLVLILQSTCFICTTWKCKQTMEQQSHRACEWTKSKQKQFDLAHKKCNGIIKAWLNVWLSMMSGHGANPIFFNKTKVQTSRTLANTRFTWWVRYWNIHLVRTQIFRKTNISYPLICICTCTYQGIRNVSFPEEWSLLDH